MSAAVVNVTALQASHWIAKVRRLLPIISDGEADRLLTSGLTLRGIMAELFRMVTQDPAWLADNIANDNEEFRCACPVTHGAQQIAGATCHLGTGNVALSTIPPACSPAGCQGAQPFTTVGLGPLGCQILKGNSAPRSVSPCRVQKPGNKVTGVTI